jgi:hypothetical protein
MSDQVLSSKATGQWLEEVFCNIWQQMIFMKSKESWDQSEWLVISEVNTNL